MLVNSKHKNEKIVWGLLSYTLEEGLTSVEQQQLLEEYQSQPQYDIYLYKTKESDNYIGVVVIERVKAESDEHLSIIIHRVSLLPSFRHEGEGYQIYCELRQLYPSASFQGSMMMSEIVKNWSVKYRLESEK